MITLPDVTYVMVETLSHKMARLAMEDCLSKVEFGEVLLLTDDLTDFKSLLGGSITNGHSRPIKVRTHIVPNWPTKIDWCRANWFVVPPLIRTSHILFCQWDAGVWNPNDWNDEFLKYDFIGALWQWHPSKRVGNTGFCLKSTRLARYIYDRAGKYPCDSEVEDDLLCRKYRTDLEERGFEWAPESVAHRFAFEGAWVPAVAAHQPTKDVRPPLESHFGFHGAFNFNRVFSAQQLEERGRLMLGDAYISNSYIMQNFLSTLNTTNPEVLTQLLPTQQGADNA